MKEQDGQSAKIASRLRHNFKDDTGSFSPCMLPREQSADALTMASWWIYYLTLLWPSILATELSINP
ncbi:hypothetical protein Ciccas_013131, partial [Cichlidogyrus casuarinus]